MSSEIRRVRTIAPAKINWTLEVLGRREDEYHEIRSVMQTIDLCDEVSVEPANELRLEIRGDHEATEEDHAQKAARLLAERMGRELPVFIRIEKRIPVASGLGGGSSDAAAVLRLLNRLHGLALPVEELAAVGARVGSDVPFFLYGGTALVEGRGERVTMLPDAPETWVVLVVPPDSTEGKTARMYAALRDQDFTDGSWTEKAVAAVRAGKAPDVGIQFNAFQVLAYQTFRGTVWQGDALLIAGAKTFTVAGSGPAIFSVTDSRSEAEAVGREAGVVGAGFSGAGAKVYVARTLSAPEATTVTD